MSSAGSLFFRFIFLYPHKHSWNEEVTMELSDPAHDTLVFHVWDHEKLSRRHALGHVSIDNLASLTQGVECNRWLRLDDVASGELNVTLLALDFGVPIDVTTAAAVAESAHTATVGWALGVSSLPPPVVHSQESIVQLALANTPVGTPLPERGLELYTVDSQTSAQFGSGMKCCSCLVCGGRCCGVFVVVALVVILVCPLARKERTSTCSCNSTARMALRRSFISFRPKEIVVICTTKACSIRIPL